jgi:hypothetical protein
LWKPDIMPGRIDALADDYFFKYLEYDDELAPAA